MTETTEIQDIDDDASVQMTNVSISYDFRFEVDRETFNEYISGVNEEKAAERIASRIIQNQHKETFDVAGSVRVVVDEVTMWKDTVGVTGVAKQ